MSHVSAQWLSQVLGHSIDSAKPGELAGGIAVTSQVGAFHLESVNPPKSVVVKLRRPGWQMDTLYLREIRFYKELATELGDLVPHCHYVELDEESGDFVIVLEDLSAATPGHNLEGLSWKEGQTVAQALGTYHGKMWDDERASTWPSKTYSKEDGDRIKRHFDKQWPLLVSQGKYEIQPPIFEIVPQIGERLPKALSEMSKGPRTLIHSDIHAENLLLDRDRVVIIDWQNAAFANPVFDLSGLFLCCHSQIQRNHYEELLDCWSEAAIKEGAPKTEVIPVAKIVPLAVIWNFVGVASWLATFEAEKLRDSRTLQSHWRRLSSGLLASWS